MTQHALLRASDLSASVGDKEILKHIDLSINQDETHILMGPNGAGKSTLGHVLLGDPAFEITSGNIHFDGEDITDLSVDKRARAGLFLSFQAPVEIPGVPLASFLRSALSLIPGREMKNKEFRNHLKELAAELDLDPSYLDRELGVGFSGGEKKKIEMLQLLLFEPKLAILDETDSGLDVDALSVVSRGIKAYQKRCQGSLLIVTHNTRILEHLSIDKVHVMIKGSIVARGCSHLVDSINNHGFEQFVEKPQALSCESACSMAE